MLLLASVAQGSVDVGVSLGTTLAVVCSWQRNRSLLWAILHGILSWLYVLYFAFTRAEDEKRKNASRKGSSPHESARPKKTSEDRGFREFLAAEPLARHLDTDEQMRRYAEWKNRGSE